MSEQGENKGKLNCKECPFLKCYEEGTCYQCYCYMDLSLRLESQCDDETLHPDCPLMKGLNVRIYASEDGNLMIRNDWK